MMLHLIQAGDRHSHGGCHLVKQRLRMRVAVEDQCCRSPSSLSGKSDCLVGMKSDFDSALRRSADRTQEEGNSTGAQSRGGGHLLLGNEHRLSQRGEDLTRSFLHFRSDRFTAAQAGHRLPH